MKDIIRGSAVILIVSAILLIINAKLNEGGGSGGKDSITVYNWGEYIDPDLLKQFEKETGIRIIYETFDSNEGMMGKIEQGGTSYDISMPSEYMIEMMKEADLLLPLD